MQKQHIFPLVPQYGERFDSLLADYENEQKALTASVSEMETQMSAFAEDTDPVSYTHLDVYKRQISAALNCRKASSLEAQSAMVMGICRLACRVA